MTGCSKPSIDSADGRKWIRDLIRPTLPHDLHDYILETLSKAATGRDVVMIVPTGGGKTSLFYGFMKLLEELAELGDSCPFETARFPRNPLLVAVFPTKGLEEEMEATFIGLDIPALAINEDTLSASPDLWKKAASPDLRALILSPEQLSTKQFDRLLQNDDVSSRMVGTAIDELHLVLDWGSPEFRESFREIGNIHHRMPDSALLLGVSATLPAGFETEKIISVLGLEPGRFFFMRRSNIRRDVQYIQRSLRHGLGGSAFPDLGWVLEKRRKTIIYCDTISLAFRVFVYLWFQIPDSESSSRQSRLRMYCSLFTKEYNQNTRSLFIDDANLQIIISTDALKVGNDFPNVADVIVLNATNVNDIMQKIGRAGRRFGLIKDPGPRGIVYVTKTALERARNLLEGKPTKKRLKKLNSEDPMPKNLAKFLLASCHIEELNHQYDNPISESTCCCEACSSHLRPHPSVCFCSGCHPEPQVLPLPPALRQPVHDDYIPLSESLNKEMKARGREALHAVRHKIWHGASATSATFRYLSPGAILPDKVIDQLLQNFAHLKSELNVKTYLEGQRWILPHTAIVWEEVQSLRKQFNRMRLGLDPTSKEDQEASSRTLSVPQAQPLARSYSTFFQTIEASRSNSASTTSQRPPAQPLQARVSGANPQLGSVLDPSTSTPSKRKASLSQTPGELTIRARPRRGTRTQADQNTKPAPKRKATLTELPGVPPSTRQRLSVKSGNITLVYNYKNK
ncbi:hypothetical protein V5O48_017175 [Marasmius crinis-equi]|uniref:DNA 3'-5' helicase n=1 Tax=Marasmius crinis-equi TaxID=585013 RepID=A0ABR3EPX0_9AGAR